MRLAVMQPYFLPYIGYFQLIAAADIFIIYDNIKYTKKGWINRNRILINSKESTISLPLQNASDSLNVRDRELALGFNRNKLAGQLREAYRRAPYFEPTFSLVEEIIHADHNNLFDYLHHSVLTMCQHLGIETSIIKSSEIQIDHELKGQDKVLALCKSVDAHTYINPIGGVTLYSKQNFSDHGVTLKFIKSKEFNYPQFGGEFVPWLSIIDVLMFNSLDSVRECISSNYELN